MLTEHRMHAESFSINREACDIINRTKERKGRVIAVGTTSCRVIETVATNDGRINPGEGKPTYLFTRAIVLKLLTGLSISIFRNQHF